jgi:Rrf2 family protein
MQLSTRSRYAVRAMIELALNIDNRPLQLREIARRQEISEKYLEQIFHTLRTANLVGSQKGSRGGYFLARPPAEITVYDVVDTMEGSVSPVSCIDSQDDCKKGNACSTHDVWVSLKNLVAAELKGINLADLARRQEELTPPLNQTGAP